MPEQKSPSTPDYPFRVAYSSSPRLYLHSLCSKWNRSSRLRHGSGPDGVIITCARCIRIAHKRLSTVRRFMLTIPELCSGRDPASPLTSLTWCDVDRLEEYT